MSKLRLRMKRTRKGLKLSQKEVADILGLSRKTINRYENGYYLPFHTENYINSCVFYLDLFYTFAGNAFMEDRISKNTLDKFIGRFE